MSIYEKFCSQSFDENGRLVKIDLKFPDNFNFAYDVCDEIADRSPEKRALVWCGSSNVDLTFSFGDMKTLSNKAANVFMEAGIKKGDRVLLILKKHWEYWPVVLALHKIGAVAIPATHMLTVDDLVYRIKSAKIVCAVCTPEDDIPKKLTEALAKSSASAVLYSVRRDIKGFVNLNEKLKYASAELERVPTLSTDPMLLYFTSGTTGYPKGVVHDFSYPLAHIVTAKYWQQAEDGGLHFTVAETGWAKASWGKIYGQWLVESAVMAYDFDNFDPKQLVSVINRFGVTSFCAPPTVYRYLIRKGVQAMHTLKHASTAGEALAPEVFRLFKELTGLTLREGYGQTETTLLTADFEWDTGAPGALGRPSPFYNIDVLDEDGRPVKDGEVGEVVVIPPKGGRQVGIFTAYLDAPEQYKHVWRGGVYHTGDAAYRDGDGRLWFHGRFDDIIKTGGFRVGPYEVENVLTEHPAVLECSVIGVPDPFRGQAIKAYIVLSKGYSPSSELMLEIKDFCNKRLAEYKWVRLIEFVPELPKTISGKIQKTVLREEAGKK